MTSHERFAKLLEALAQELRTSATPVRAMATSPLSNRQAHLTHLLICFWEDDIVQLRWPDFARGANRRSLIDSQVNYRDIGAIEGRLLEHVRPAESGDDREAAWRPADPDPGSVRTALREDFGLAERPDRALLVASDILAIETPQEWKAHDEQVRHEKSMEERTAR